MANPPPPNDPRFGPTPLPDWVEGFRPVQWEKIEEVVDAFRSVDVVFLQAPTGTGKTLIAETVRRLLGERRTPASALYTCSTKALQDQFANDYPYAKVLKGRSNYLTESGSLNQMGVPVHTGRSAITCADCTWTPESRECRWCNVRNQCPYQRAKLDAATSRLAVLNTAYLLTDANKGPGAFVGRDICILDEADLLENELLNFTELDITDRRLERCSVPPPTSLGRGSKTRSDLWVKWIEEIAVPGFRRYVRSLPNPGEPGTSARDIKDWYSTNQIIEQLHHVSRELPEGGWVYDGYNHGHAIFRPTRVDQYGGRYLWPHARKFLLMSATILSADSMAEELGLEKPFRVVDVPSGYPKERRPIYLAPVANMSMKTQEADRPKLVTAILNILKQHEGERVLIHTVSYELAGFISGVLRGSSDRPVYTYTSTDGKDGALRDYKRRRGSVLVAPSMDRGIDLPGDLCRVQIVAKIPFPNLGDKRISARMHGKRGAEWYKIQAVRTLIQSTGRGMRGEEDQVATYILDSQFESNLWRNDYLFPRWWREAIVWKYKWRNLLEDA